MSKIAEKKALEAYPIAYYRNGGGIDDANASDRAVYQEGYNQAIQDFLEKACEWLKDNSKKYVICYEDGYSHYAYNSMIDDLKNYMQNESEK
jgi:hypothetical protein